MIAKAGGSTDPFLEDFVRKMKPEDRASAELAAKPWIAAVTAASRRQN